MDLTSALGGPHFCEIPVAEYDPSGMGGPAAPPRRSQDDVILVVRSKLIGYFEEVGRATSTFVELVRLRNRLAHTQYLHEQQRADFEAIFREAGRAVARQLDQVALDKRWSVLLRHWNTALVEAAEKLERDEERRRAFKAFASEQTDEDEEFGLGATRATAARLRDAS
jgi:hypothetical protein